MHYHTLGQLSLQTSVLPEVDLVGEAFPGYFALVTLSDLKFLNYSIYIILLHIHLFIYLCFFYIYIFLISHISVLLPHSYSVFFGYFIHLRFLTCLFLWTTWFSIWLKNPVKSSTFTREVIVDIFTSNWYLLPDGFGYA